MKRITCAGLTCLVLFVATAVLPESPAPVDSRNALVTTFRAAFAQGDWTTAARTAREILALDEQTRGPTDPALVPVLLNVASAESELGNTAEAQNYIARATVLLGLRPDPVQGFSRDLVLAKTYLKLGRFVDAQRQCRQALKAVDGNPAVSTSQKSQAYLLLLEVARRTGDFRLGNDVAGDMLKAEQQALGKDATARVTGLYDAASWYRSSSQLVQERDVLADAVALLEKAYGPNDPRLAYPLWTTGMSYLVGHSSPEKSLAAIERAIALPPATTTGDVVERAQMLASRGDHSVVFGDPAASGPDYTAAWKMIALDPRLGAAVANETFARPLRLYVNVPVEAFSGVKGGTHNSRGEITFAFTVTEQGLIDGLRIKDQELDRNSLPTPLVQAFREARYRPRVVDGKPVATADQEYRFRVGIDRRSESYNR